MRPVLAALFYLALGLYVIRFSPSAYTQPVACIERWYSWLPNTRWGVRILRGFAVFWIFGAVFMILGALQLAHRFRLLLATFAVCAVVTAILIPRGPKPTQMSQ